MESFAVDISGNENKSAYFSIMNGENIYCDMYITKEKKYRSKKNWDIANTTTVIDWINTANLYILMMDIYAKDMRHLLRVNTLWSLMISSITSTISITQFTIDETNYPELSFAIKMVIFITSLVTSIITGYIKVEKIQEKIETIDGSREKWMKFMTIMTNELQVSSKLRNDAEELISKHRSTFNELSFRRIEIPKSIEEKTSIFITTRKKRNMELERSKNSCYTRYTICRCSTCMRPNELKNIIELTQQRLSTFIMTRKLLYNELLLLGKSYSNVISDIAFKTDTELLDYKITTKSVKLIENMVNGEKQYSPISSDGEDDNDANDDNESENKIIVDRNDSHITVDNKDGVINING
jgi:hypothetical protein